MALLLILTCAWNAAYLQARAAFVYGFWLDESSAFSTMLPTALEQFLAYVAEHLHKLM